MNTPIERHWFAGLGTEELALLVVAPNHFFDCVDGEWLLQAGFEVT